MEMDSDGEGANRADLGGERGEESVRADFGGERGVNCSGVLDLLSGIFCSALKSMLSIANGVSMAL